MIKINRLIWAVLCACAAFAGDDSQHFDEAYTDVLASFNRMRERVAEDFQELGRDHGLVADDLIKEATVSKPMEGVVFLDEHFKDTLDKAIERVGFNFIRMSLASPIVQARFASVNASVFTPEKAEYQKRLVARLCGDTDRLQDPEALARYGKDPLVCAQKVCHCSHLLKTMARVRECRELRRKAVNTFVETVIDEMYACVRKEKSGEYAWAASMAMSYLKDEKVLQDFLKIPPKIGDGAQCTPAERERLERQAKTHRAELRYVILKLLDEYMDPCGYGDKFCDGQALRERALCAANIILYNAWKKVKMLFPRFLDQKDRTKEDPAIAPVKQEIMRVDNSPEKNSLIIARLSQEKSFKDGILLLEDRISKRITLTEFLDRFMRAFFGTEHESLGALGENISPDNDVSMQSERTDKGFLERPLLSDGLIVEVD